MSFNFTLCKNKSEPEKIGKDITDVVTCTGTLKEPSSFIDPVILVEGSISDISQCNYARIHQFGRKYFITNIKAVRNGLFEISCHVDVLETYKDEIKENKAIIHRSETDYELDFDDGSIKTFNNPKITTKSFPNGFTTAIEFVLAVAGGPGNA